MSGPTSNRPRPGRRQGRRGQIPVEDGEAAQRAHNSNDLAEHRVRDDGQAQEQAGAAHEHVPGQIETDVNRWESAPELVQSRAGPGSVPTIAAPK